MSYMNLTKIKIIVIGNASTGKTSLATRFIEDKFPETYSATIGTDFLSKTLTIGETSVKINIWDLAGQERFQSMMPSYFRQADGCVLVFDSTNAGSNSSRSKWAEMLKTHAPPNIVTIICSNKIDKKNAKFYQSRKEVYKNTEGYNGFFETSAKTGKGVDNMFRVLITLILRSRQIKNPKPVYPNTRCSQIIDNQTCWEIVPMSSEERSKEPQNKKLSLEQKKEAKDSEQCMC